jgi:hypothetical protein
MNLNDVVTVNGGSRLAVLVERFDYGGKQLFHARYIDTKTGKMMKCPDPRCAGAHTCPIHGTNIERANVVPEHDLKFYNKNGMLGRGILERAFPRLRKVNLRCAICGRNAPGRQWWNQDDGFGLCPNCGVSLIEKEGFPSVQKGYGFREYHWDVKGSQ